MPIDSTFSDEKSPSFLPDAFQQPPTQSEMKQIMANKISPPWTNLVVFPQA